MPHLGIQRIEGYRQNRRIRTTKPDLLQNSINGCFVTKVPCAEMLLQTHGAAIIIHTVLKPWQTDIYFLLKLFQIRRCLFRLTISFLSNTRDAAERAFQGKLVSPFGAGSHPSVTRSGGGTSQSRPQAGQGLSAAIT